LPETNPPEWMVEILELDFELAAALKDKIIHSAVLWFTGEALNDLDLESDEEGIGGFKFDDPDNYKEDDDEDYDPDDDAQGDVDPPQDCKNQ